MSSTERVARPASAAPDQPPEGLRAHWERWLGAEPAQVSALGRQRGDGPPQVRVVGSRQREEPAWDGEAHPVTGIVDPGGNAVVSVPTRHEAWA
ncbi:MAG: hypothetical protein ACRDWY_18000, partial [Actinomycetes bacterium]